MNRKVSVVILTSVIAIIVASLFLYLRTGPHATTTTVIKLVGTKGLMFKGTITTNGVEVAVSGTLPAEFTLSGRSVDCSFQKTQPEGDIRIDVLSTDSGSREAWASGSATTDKPEGGVRGHLHKGRFSNEFDATTF